MLKYNKAWVAGIAAPLTAMITSFFNEGLGIPGFEPVASFAVAAFLTWLVPNKG